MGDLPLVEETRQVGLHLGASGHSHAQREEAPQVLLYQGEVVPIQPLLPGLLRPVAFLRRNRENANIRRVASQRSNVLDFTASCEDTNDCLWTFYKPSEGPHLRRGGADVCSCSPGGQTGTIFKLGQ